MLLTTPNLCIIPFESTDDAGVAALIQWYYNEKYNNFFRHQPRPWKIDEFRNYPRVTNSEVFFVKDRKTMDLVGLIQVNSDCKTNRGFYIGLLIDERYQKKRYPLEAFISIFDHYFNRLGYRKAIVEILADHEGLKRIVTENGFTYEGRFTDECFVNGAFVDEIRYSMFDIEYNNKFKPILNQWNKNERISK